MLLVWYYPFLAEKKAVKVAARITRCFVYYLFFNKKVGAWTTQKLPYGLTRTALTSALYVPRKKLKFSWFLNKTDLIWLKNSFLKLRFLKRTKWLFRTIKPFQEAPRMCISFPFSNWSGCNQYNLEWLKSKTPRPFLSNVAFFHMKCLFAPNPLSGSPKCTFQCPRGLISTQQKKSFDQHSTNFWKLN